MKYPTLAAVAAALAVASGSLAAAGPLRLTLTPAPGGQRGSVTIYDNGQSFTVVIRVRPAQRAPQRARIQQGSCREYTSAYTRAREAATVTELASVRHGRSRTTVSLPYAYRADGAHSIDIRSGRPPYAPTACADIPALR